MSKIKKGDTIVCVSSRCDDFFAGCYYSVEKVDSNGYVHVYGDEGNKVAVDYPSCPKYGTFKKVD